MDKLCTKTIKKDIANDHLIKMKDNFLSTGHTEKEYECYAMGFNNCLSLMDAYGNLYFLEDDEINNTDC